MSNEIKSETTLTLKTAIAEIGKTSPINLSLLLSKENDCRLEISGDGYNLFIYGIENLSQLIHDLDRMKMRWADYEENGRQTEYCLLKPLAEKEFKGFLSTPVPKNFKGERAFGVMPSAFCPDDEDSKCIAPTEKFASGQLCQCRECKD